MQSPHYSYELSNVHDRLFHGKMRIEIRTMSNHIGFMGLGGFLGPKNSLNLGFFKGIGQLRNFKKACFRYSCFG